MKCPRCQHENQPGQKFCGECGTRLAVACASCGASNAPAQKFCGECGAGLAPEALARSASPESYTPKHLAEKILTSKAALEGERKQVTVLFADLKGSMELLADRDPEEARKILDPVLELMMEAVHHYEGTVNQVMGDGIMALFGAPVAHEDHAVRACYAALRMQHSVKHYAEEVRRREGTLVHVRVGLNSGEVVVRSIESDLRMDYTAVGQTTHLAARMEQLAMPGSVLMSADTLRLAEGFIEVKPLGPVNVKGLSDSVDVFEVVGGGPVRTRLQASARRGLTRFVGRDAELEQLRRAQQLAGDGHGQVAAIVGEAGLGKTRLVYEFTHSHRLHGWLVLESASVSYGKATSYLPVIDLLKGYFKIQDRDDLREIREKVTGKLLTLDESLRPTLSALLALLDVPADDATWQAFDPSQRRQHTLDAIRRLLLREAREQPVLLIFEDLHWIDGETQAFLDGLVESLPTARLLLLVNYRPEYRHAWGGKTYYRQLRIDPLPPESADELLDALLGTDVALGPLKQLLVGRTEANPLFLEESVRALVETSALAGDRGAYRLTRSVEHLKIPATVQAILAARIDRLAPEAKRLLQAAAVIGKDVPMPLLLAIADAPEHEVRSELAHLQAAEFLYETRLFPDLEYTFKHALTHEVAYQGLLHDRQRALHARITAAIEQFSTERVAEHVERLAHHAVRGELPDKAVHYVREAGVRAVARSALQDGRAWFEQALGVLESQPESQRTMELAFATRLNLRAVLAQLGEIRVTLERLREAEALAERLNDDLRRGQVCAFMANTHSLLGQVDEARAYGERALTIAHGLEDLQLRMVATSFLEQVHYFRGEYDRVVNLASENLAASPADLVDRYGKLAPTWTDDRLWLVLSLAQLGRFGDATEHDVEAIRLAVPAQRAYILVQAHRAAGMLRILQGAWATARRPIDYAIAVSRTASLSFFLADVVGASAWVLAYLGETDEALERIREGKQLLEGHEARGLVGRLGSGYHALGRACLQLGRLAEAHRFSDRALAFSPRHPGFAADALHLKGDIATHPEGFDPERGEAYYREALALAEPRGMRPLVAHCHLGLSMLYRRTDRREHAQEHLSAATTMYRDMGMTYWLEKAEAEFGA